MSVTLLLRGDQLGSYVSASLAGNVSQGNAVLTVSGVEAVGPRTEFYTVLVEQLGSSPDEFNNGQFITITAPDGTVIVPRTGVQDDAFQGLAAGDEHLIIQNPRFVIDLGGLDPGPADIEYTVADKVGDPDSGDNDGNLDFEDFPCLVAGTMVETVTGPVRAEAIAPGDRLPGKDGSVREVIWARARTLTLDDREDPNKPILLPRGCLGARGPDQDLMLSPQHRIAIDHPLVRDLFGVPAVLLPARGALPLPGARVMRGKTEVTYVSILLDRHGWMRCNGLWAESFYPGPEGLKSLGPRLRQEVEDVVPGLARWGACAYGRPAARFLTVREGRELCTALRQSARSVMERATRQAAPL